jgi:hypothetical protein
MNTIQLERVLLHRQIMRQYVPSKSMALTGVGSYIRNPKNDDCDIFYLLEKRVSTSGCYGFIKLNVANPLREIEVPFA